MVQAPKKEKEKKEKPKQEKKEKPKKEEPMEVDEPLVVVEKKKDPLDALPKGTFDLEEWKRFYSNNDEDASCEWFWKNFDTEHYSIWRGDYREGGLLSNGHLTIFGIFCLLRQYLLFKNLFYPVWTQCPIGHIRFFFIYVYIYSSTALKAGVVCNPSFHQPKK